MGVLFLPSDQPLDELIASAQAAMADDSEAMAEILCRFDAAIWATANSTTAEWNLRQDAAQGARLGLVKAVRAHKPGTEGFKSYARLYMKSEARRVVQYMAGVDIARDPEVFVEPSASDRPVVVRQCKVPAEDTVAFEFETVIEVLTIDQQSVVRGRYLHDLRVADIARDLGISVPAVSQRLKTIHSVLRPVLIEAMAA